MGFVPRSGDHALVEVVFGLRLNRSMTTEEIASLKSGHAEWKDFLPRVSDLGVNEFSFGPNGIVAPRMVPRAGVNFERVKPDGSIAWRYSFEGESIFINCLEYTSWSDIFPQVMGIASLMLGKLNDPELTVININYQAVDLFSWSGEVEKYDISKLLDVDGENVPRRMRESGLIWHLHQGWFEPAVDVTGIDGRLLNRMHFDAIEHGQDNTSPEVRVDATLQHSLHEPIELTEVRNANGPIFRIFEGLHAKNKEMLRSFLVSDVSDSIGLGG